MIALGAPLPQNSWFKIREVDPGAFGAGARQTAGWLLLLCFTAGSASASPQAASSAPNTEAIITRMAQARTESRARLRPYVVTRNYKLFGNDESKARSEVTADVAFVPPDSKHYTIEEANGSGMGTILVRRMLAVEAEVEKDHPATDLTTDNYDFRFLREVDASGRHCYVLGLLPRRKEQHLLRGDIWVDAETYLPRRFEGAFARSPSWWVKDVKVTFEYNDVGGMWLQTSTEAVAEVRILGRSTMVSRDMKYKITDLVASATAEQTNFLVLMPGGPFRLGAVPRPPK